MHDHILIPVAFDEDSDSLLRRAIEVARRLAAEGGRITLLHVMEQLPAYAVNYLPADYLAQSRVAVQAALEALAAGLPGGVAEVVDGHSARTILDWAQIHGVGLIVMPSHRPGMQDLLIGSTAARVVRHARCAVHVLR